MVVSGLPRSHAILALAIALAGCAPAGELTASRASGIVGGEIDEGDPAVVRMSAEVDGCTGTLVAPMVVLTAAHCVYDAAHAGGAAGTVGFGTSIDSFDQTIAIVDVFAHPLYDPAVIHRHDIGLVRLARKPRGIAPMPIDTGDLGPDIVGTSVRVIGFGVTDSVVPIGAGTKRHVELTVDELTPALIGVGDDARNICFGDSGGPVLRSLDGVDTVIGVSSYGDLSCAKRAYAARLDVSASVIAELIAAWSGRCQHDGRCPRGPCGQFPDPDCDPCGLNGMCSEACERDDLDCPWVEALADASVSSGNGDAGSFRDDGGCAVAPPGSRPILVLLGLWIGIAARRNRGVARATTRSHILSMIRKLANGKYRLYSRKKDKRTGKRRNLGTFRTLAEAKRHERAVQFFKRGGSGPK